ASGADVPYPPSKRGLYRAIVQTQAAVSEMPPGFQPYRWCFPARNRTIAGLATLTIVVEATERSGSLITAEFAQDLGRAVGAVPGRRVPVVLSIAGSDSGGGAGIQADLKAFARAGVHGATAITAITVQNTVAVSAVQPVAPEIIAGQVRAVAEDLGVDAVKI